MKPFFIDETYNAAFLANILGRLRETINEDCKNSLKQRGINTPVTDVSLLLFIEKHPGCSIADIARGLAHSHQRTAARMSAMLQLALVRKEISAEDSRCTNFYLTGSGMQDAMALKEVYGSVALSLEALFEELDCNLLQTSMKAIASLQHYPLSQRIDERLNATPKL